MRDNAAPYQATIRGYFSRYHDTPSLNQALHEQALTFSQSSNSQ